MYLALVTFTYTGLYAAAYVARNVFAHTGPSDGGTADKGWASVLYEIQTGSLQAAGNDYTATLTYVATPTF